MRDVSLCPTMRKPFDVIAEGLLVSSIAATGRLLNFSSRGREAGKQGYSGFCQGNPVAARYDHRIPSASKSNHVESAFLIESLSARRPSRLRHQVQSNRGSGWWYGTDLSIPSNGSRPPKGESMLASIVDIPTRSTTATSCPAS